MPTGVHHMPNNKLVKTPQFREPGYANPIGRSNPLPGTAFAAFAACLNLDAFAVGRAGRGQLSPLFPGPAP